MSAHVARRLAWSIWIVALFCLAVGMLLLIPNHSTLGRSSFLIIPSASLPGLTYTTLGALIAARHPRNPIGWTVAKRTVVANQEDLGNAKRCSGETKS